MAFGCIFFLRHGGWRVEGEGCSRLSSTSSLNGSAGDQPAFEIVTLPIPEVKESFNERSVLNVVVKSRFGTTCCGAISEPSGDHPPKPSGDFESSVPSTGERSRHRRLPAWAGSGEHVEIERLPHGPCAQTRTMSPVRSSASQPFVVLESIAMHRSGRTCGSFDPPHHLPADQVHEFFVLRLRHRASIGRYFPEIKSHLPGIVETSLTIRTGFPLPVDFFRLRYSATARRLEHSRQLLS